MVGRRAIPALVAALALVLALPATGSAAKTMTRKEQAKRLLAPLRAFERETRADRPVVRAALRTWQDETSACLATAKQDLAAAPGAQTELTALRVAVLHVHIYLDGFKRSFASVGDDLLRAERRWRNLRLTHTRLRLLAGWQVEGLTLARRTFLPSTCSAYAEWKATGFDAGKIPPASQAVFEEVDSLDSEEVDAARRTLRAIVGLRLEDRFAQFPLAYTLALASELTAPLDRALA